MRIRHTSLIPLFTFLIVITSVAVQAQPIERTWDLKWINPPAYLSDIGEVSIIPDWSTTNRPIGPVLANFSDDHLRWIDSVNNTIYEMGPNYSLLSSQPLVPTDQTRRASAMSEDGSTLALALEEIVGGQRFVSVFLRTRNEGGSFGNLQLLHRPANDFERVSFLQIAPDGDTLAWTERRSGGYAVMVMQNLHSQPTITQLMVVRNLSTPTLLLSADGRWVIVRVWNSGFDLQQGLEDVVMFSRFSDDEWSAADYLRVDGEVYHGSVRDVNSDGSFLQIGLKVVYREGDEFHTLYDFEPTRFDKLGGSMTEDGRSVVFLSGDEDPWDSLDPRERSRLERTSLPERDLVLVTFDPDRDEPVQTHVIDSGFMFEYHYKKDGSRLVWTKQEEDPFRDRVSVDNWPELGED